MKRKVNGEINAPAAKRQRIGKGPFDNTTINNNENNEKLNTNVNSTLPPLVHETKGIEFSFESYGGSDKGKKPHMEDRRISYSDLYEYKALQYFKLNKCSLFGVFDGHGGSKVASYCQKKFVDILIEKLDKYVISTSQNNNKELLIKNIQKSIHSTFKTLDSKILEWISPIKREGSTSTIIFIHNSLIFCGNVGDSKAVLGRLTIAKKDILQKVIPLELTSNHNCLLLSEVKRVESFGGNITSGRVNGILEVTRSFGDPEFKKTKVINAIPSISKFELCFRDKFLIIACDGLWSVFSINDAITFINDKLNDKCSPSVQEVVRNLLAEAILSKQAKDNVSAIIIRFKF